MTPTQIWMYLKIATICDSCCCHFMKALALFKSYMLYISLNSWSLAKLHPTEPHIPIGSFMASSRSEVLVLNGQLQITFGPLFSMFILFA